MPCFALMQLCGTTREPQSTQNVLVFQSIPGFCILSILVSPQQFHGLFQGCPNLFSLPPLCLRVRKGPTTPCRSSHEEIRLLWMILTGGSLQGHTQRYPGAVIARGDEILRETQPLGHETTIVICDEQQRGERTGNSN